MACCVQSIGPKTLWVQPPFTVAECHIVHDEDWYDPLPQFLDGDDTQPTNLDGKRIEIYIRPVYDHTLLIAKLSTDDGTIVIDDAQRGMASVNVGRAQVADLLPVGTWQHFCVESEPEGTDPADGRRYLERFRGPFIVHPGRT